MNRDFQPSEMRLFLGTAAAHTAWLRHLCFPCISTFIETEERKGLGRAWSFVMAITDDCLIDTLYEVTVCGFNQPYGTHKTTFSHGATNQNSLVKRPKCRKHFRNRGEGTKGIASVRGNC